MDPKITPRTTAADEESQPKPEHFLDLIRRQRRGRLKIYLGFAAGVGKTYDMLQEGNRLHKQGVDVVIGFVETHGRAETMAQIGEVEQVPRSRIEYRGIVLEELDLEAVLQRRPTIALVDELAHTNAPGSRNGKRYQDVAEILRAGINVITTLNIQHLESLHDIVERATGVRVKERLPDYVVTMADQIVNVDLSAEDLRERLQQGKIYPPERIQTALENFFAPEKLTQLRELAMEEIAFRLDRSRREDEQRGGPPASASERVMVCLSSRSPQASALLRKASRIADRLGAPWYAVYVQTPREAPEYVAAATQRQIGNSLDLARQLGGTSLAFKGTDLITTIAAFVGEYGITHVILGRTRQPWYRRWFGRSILDRLLQAVPGVDVTVVDNGPPRSG
ncbi:MAG: universal stress protein [Planctomycetota bacterium]|nr:universal stress protein [Planctomycetota bacterium]